MKVRIRRFDLDEMWKPYSRPVWTFTIYSVCGNVYITATHHDRWKAVTLQQITPIVLEGREVTDRWRATGFVEELITEFTKAGATCPVNPSQLEALAAIMILVGKLVLDRVELTFTV